MTIIGTHSLNICNLWLVLHKKFTVLNQYSISSSLTEQSESIATMHTFLRVSEGKQQYKTHGLLAYYA